MTVVTTTLPSDGVGEVSCARTTLMPDTGVKKKLEKERGTLDWMLGKQLRIYYYTCLFFCFVCFLAILSQANRSKAAQREKAG